MSGPEPGRALVIGYGSSGRAATRWLLASGWQVLVLEDSPAAVGALPGGGTEPTFVLAPRPDRGRELARQADLVVPSPGVHVDHPALVAAEAAGVPVLSELELGWEQLLALRATAHPARTCPLVAITGTNGKTTVTELVAAMLSASGHPAVAAGNVGYPLLEAVNDLGPGDAVIVAEVSSFQLHYTKGFRPDVSCWLNFAPDHLDWHPSLDHYARAKQRIWANQVPGSTVVFNADDPVVTAAAASVPAGVRLVSFGAAAASTVGTPPAPAATWRTRDGSIEGPGGIALGAVELPRALPHDLANTAAAMAVALSAGATPEGCLEAARRTPAPPHRVELVAESDGVTWYDDSKATSPAAVQAAVRGFGSVVLIAGGRNKGLDLSCLATTVPPVRAVVAIGESSPEVSAAFEGLVPVRKAGTMEEAVGLAGEQARPGDAIVLSPGCASFDWYSS
ncbi:MAG: UDP-N-acetylmuramoyl-L-alanine--D-glutamate ligase, partial [Acidimicrobiales bacterium]